MIVRFTASNVVAMILFIPLLLAVGLILAFVVPVLAIIAATAGILFVALYVLARVGLLKKQLAQRNSELAGGKEKAGLKRHKKKASIDVKDYKVR